jgi:uncharacterized protein (DUF983 family)
MEAKESKLKSIIQGTCPKCHVGRVFIHKNPYASWSFTKMHDHCSHCGQSFDPEPGFYQGAMYVSYALTLAITFPVGLLLLFVLNVDLFVVLAVLTFLLLAFLPVIFRLSRLVWLNFFIRYRPSASSKQPE